VLWATGPAPQGWLRDTGLELDERGYLAVDECLRVGGRPNVYAAGDVASIAGHTRPKAGVYAVREAPVLAENLKRTLRGEQPRRYMPQRLALALIGTADCRAVGAYGPLSLEGEWVWRWKDAIDRKFVQRYRA
jgi:selenide, water dikinase